MSLLPVEHLIQVRMQQAKESLTEAETLYRSSLFRGENNRSYYAMFYAVSALAVLRQEPTSKHSRLIAFFDRQFVKPGIFSKDFPNRCIWHFKDGRRTITEMCLP